MVSEKQQRVNAVLKKEQVCFGKNTKAERPTITQRVMESHIAQDGSNIVLIEEVKQGKQVPQAMFI